MISKAIYSELQMTYSIKLAGLLELEWAVLSAGPAFVKVPLMELLRATLMENVSVIEMEETWSP